MNLRQTGSSLKVAASLPQSQEQMALLEATAAQRAQRPATGPYARARSGTAAASGTRRVRTIIIGVCSLLQDALLHRQRRRVELVGSRGFLLPRSVSQFSSMIRLRPAPD